MADTSTSTLGPTLAATSATLVELGADPSTDAHAALALHLAATLDAGAGSQVAPVARELRNILDALNARHNRHDDAFDLFMARLSTPVHPDE